MKPAFAMACLLLLLGLWCIGSQSAMAQGSDPFALRPDSDPKQDSAKNVPAKAKEPERIFKTNDEWQKILTADQFLVTRMKNTESAFSGKYWHGHYKGTFLCVCCGAKLFDAKHKFDSGTGWPSFYRPVGNSALESAWDYSEPEARVEVTCRRCGAHLGHVFQDGPPPTGLRFCINSIALKLDSEKGKSASVTPARRSSRASSAKTARSGRTPSPSSAARSAPKTSSEAEPKS
jgi:peptide-methionine (R)-S-oxide reductase